MSINFNGVSINGGVQMYGSSPPFSPILNLDASDLTSYSGSGSTWYDLSGHGNNFNLQGDTPWTSASNQSYFTFSTGIAQGGAILSNTEYTKIGVFRVPGTFGNLISGAGHAFWGGFTSYLQSGHNGAWYTVASANPVPTNQWVFGAVSFSNINGWRLYLNADTVVTNPNTDQFSDNPALTEIGGFDGNANNLGGDVALVQLYDIVLTDSAVASLYSGWQSRFGF
jgi:putative cofactor-binding repeat protein